MLYHVDLLAKALAGFNCVRRIVTKTTVGVLKPFRELQYIKFMDPGSRK